MKSLVLLLAAFTFTDLSAADHSVATQVSKKDLSVGVGVGADLGFGFNPRVTSTYHLNDRQKLQLTLMSASDGAKIERNEGITDSISGEIKMRSFAAEAGYRLFFSETFSIMLGAQVANYNVDIKAYNRLANNGMDIQLNANQLNATATIGNRWNFDNDMYIGVDWIGFTKNLTNSFTKNNRFSNEFAVSQRTRRELDQKENDLRTVLAASRPRLLMLDVGYTF